MKSEWKFTFEARDCHFERKHTYEIASSEVVEVGGTRLDSFKVLVKVSPTEGQTPPGVEQLAQLVFTLPMPPEQCEDFAYFIARATVEQLTFLTHGDLRLTYGLVSGKRIAETPAEEAEIGDRPCFATLRLEEVLPAPSIESIAGRITTTSAVNPGLLAQYNETRRDTSPERKFLGFFRILESRVHRQAVSGSLKQALKGCHELRQHFTQIAPGQSFDDFVDTIVEIRHKCAHLKLERGFGYVPTDPDVATSVIPHLPVVQELARACVAGAYPRLA